MDKIKALKDKIKKWNRRYLTPLGRITVLKSLLLPSFNHLFISLPNPNEAFIKEIGTILYEFVWQGKSRVKHTIICKEYAEGGLKLTNIVEYITALKSTWIRRLSNQQCKFVSILNTEIQTDHLFNFGETYIEQQVENIKNVFWQDVFKSHLKNT